MKAAIYARKSTQQDDVADDNKSVPRQTKLAREFAEQRGWTVAPEHVYVDDGVSGAMFDEGRPGLAALLVSADRREFGVVVTMDESRIGRDQYRAAYVLQQLHDAGCEVWFYQDARRVEMDTAVGKFMESVRGFAAETEREKAGSRTREALRAKARAGFVAGSKLYGYRNVRPAPKAPVKREIEPEQAAVVKRIFESYAGGDGHRAIRDALNRDKIAGPRGAWASTTVRDMLANEVYIGRVTWGKFKPVVRAGRTINVAQPEATWVTVAAPELRIIEDALWQKAQARREQARQTTPRARNGRLLGRTSQADQKSAHLLSGFLRCGICGGPIRIEHEKRGPGRSRVVRYYLCATHHQRGAAGCGNGIKVKRGTLEAAVMKAIEQALAPEHVEEALEAFLAARRERLGQRDARRTQIEQEIAAVARRESRLVAAVTSGGDIAPLVAALKAENAKREALEVEMLELTAAPAGPKGLWVLAEDAYRAAARSRVADVLVLLEGKGGIGPTRLMLRRTLEGGSVTCHPTEQNGITGFRFETRLAVGLIVGEALASPTGGSRPGRSTCRGRDGSPVS